MISPDAPTRKDATEGTLRACSMFLLVVDSKRIDHFINWTPETTRILAALRLQIETALAIPEEP